ncbi:MAG: phosphatase PAP2 family protein [Anaerolineaceae bacterium]|nr:phosphatase PAP2 family protein [Anaerolineaceae bacterium]
MVRKIADWDRKITAFLRIEPQKGLLFKFAAALAHSGDSWIWCGVMFVIWLFADGGLERTLAYWAGAIVVTALFVFVLKRVIARARPEGTWGDVYRKTDPYSFPSGHSVRAGLILMLAIHTFRSPWLICLFAVWAVLMALSRIMTGVHYFFDVMMGFFLGLLIGWFWIAIEPWVFRTFPFLFDKSSWFQNL